MKDYDCQMKTIELQLSSLEATRNFGKKLASLLFPGAVLGLIGELGAGKTFLVRSIAEGLGLQDLSLVTSPTFVLTQEYPTDPPMFHFDVYRLHSEAELFDLGVDEYFQSEGICLFEWSNRVEGCLPSERLDIHLGIVDEVSRVAQLTGKGPAYEKIIEGLQPEKN